MSVYQSCNIYLFTNKEVKGWNDGGIESGGKGQGTKGTGMER
jgi:hypothetical protein